MAQKPLSCPDTKSKLLIEGCVMERSAYILKSLLFGGGLVALLGTQATPLLAQSITPPGSDPNATQDNPFSNRDQSASSLFGLINKIQLLNGRNPNDFAAEQDENFKDALSEYRKKQQQVKIPAVTPAPTTSSPAKLP
jgi:hypothetical protein